MGTGSYLVWPGQGTARARLFADGRAVVQYGASDLGTGTVMTQVAADALGIPPESIRFELGDTNLPTGPALSQVGNAVFHATGKRLRDLPMTPSQLLAALRQPA